MYAVSEGPVRGWSSPLIVATGIVGAAMLAVLVVVELRITEPMLDLRLLHDRLFRTSSVVIFLAMCSFFGLLYTVTLFYQDGLGLSALQSGAGHLPRGHRGDDRGPGLDPGSTPATGPGGSSSADWSPSP